MKYYTSVFPNSRIVTVKYYPSGIKEGPMAGFDGKVLTGVFELNGQQFMALDGGPVFTPSGAISFLVECETQEEIDMFWSKLSAVPGAEQCGWCTDKFGFTWQIVPDMEKYFNQTDKAKADRAMQAMLKMKKIIIKDLENA